MRVGFGRMAVTLVAVVNIASRCSGFQTMPIAQSRVSLRRTSWVSESADTIWRRDSSSYLSASVNGPVDAAGSSSAEKSSVIPSPSVLWRFTRPHTIIGSALSIPALHVLAAPTPQAALSMACFVSMMYAMVPSLLMNLFVTGLNQITDIEIDKINKPELPIPAGDLTPRTATVTVLIALALSLLLGIAHPVLGSQGLNATLWASAILGTLYSLPPFRLKRNPLLAATCIVAVRGTFINAGFFAHARYAAFGGFADPSMPSSVLQCLASDRKCLLSSLFFGVFGIVIALMKDVPDTAGDEIFKIRTFSVRLGPKIVFGAMKNLLSSLFLAVGLAFLRNAITTYNIVGLPFTFCKLAVGTFGISAASSIFHKAKHVNREDPKDVTKFYMYLWKMFYLCYFALPFVW